MADPRYRCTVRKYHQYPRSECLAKVIGTTTHYFCPTCYHPCRLAGVRCVGPVPDSKPPRIKTEAEMDAWLNLPKTCSRCDFSGCNRDFPLTTARGKPVSRSWCKVCMKAYMDQYNRGRYGPLKQRMRNQPNGAMRCGVTS